MAQRIFKQSIVGGFDKSDVLEYIEKINHEHEQESLDLSIKLEELTLEKKSTDVDIQNYKAKISALEEKNANALERLAGATVDITKLESEIQTFREDIKIRTELSEEEVSKNKLMNRSLDTYAAKVSEMERKITELERIKFEYISLKEKLPEMEIAAYKRGEEIIASSQKEAEKIKIQTTQVLSSIKGKLEPINSSYEKLLTDACEKFYNFKNEATWLCENMVGVLNALDEVYNENTANILKPNQNEEEN